MKASKWHASAALGWPVQVRNLDVKREVAARIATRAAHGDVIGIGSGSTAYLTLWAIGERVRAEALAIQVIPTSVEIEVAATTLRLPLTRLGQSTPNWSVDGADEVDPDGRLLKGRGGALFREKLLWSTSDHMILAIDPSKRVEQLGSRFPMPIEVHPNAVEPVVARMTTLGCRDCQVRTGTGKDGPVITEAGFLLLDAHFDEIPVGLHAQVKALPGVLETGLFEGYTYEIVD
ncbi:MAG: ribose 5-phosphate isomerase A [Solirubrobacteraceae bacterium]